MSGFSGWNLNILLSYLKSASSNLSCCKDWSKNKTLKFGTKNASFGYFWTRSWKWYGHIWNQHPQVCLNAKFSEETKTPKFGIKNALFWCFGATISQYCHIWNQLCRFCIIAKFCRKWKCLIWVFLTKNAFFGYFWTTIFKKTFVIFEISTLEFG